MKSKNNHILHIKDTLVCGGISVFLYRFLKQALKQQPTIKHTVAYIQTGPYVKKIEDLGITTIQLTNTFIPRYALSLFWQLTNIIKKRNITTMHAMLLNSITYARLVSYFTGVRVVCGIHGDMGRAGRFHQLTNYVSGCCATKYVCVSSTTKQQFLAQSFLKKKSVKANTIVINNGVDCSLQKSISRADVGLPENAFIVGSVGRLSPEKSFDVLLSAIAKTSAHLCLVGDGPERAMLEKHAKTLGITNRVTFLGHRTDARDLYQLFDCFGLSSQTEGLSIALLEAMAAGLPVISTHISKMHDAIIDGENGLLIPVNDIIALAHAINKLMTEPNLRTKMIFENKQRAHKQFTIELMTQKYIDLFDSLTKDP